MADGLRVTMLTMGFVSILTDSRKNEFGTFVY